MTPWTVAYQASLSIGFSRQEYWSGFLFPSPGDIPNPGIELSSVVKNFPANAGDSRHASSIPGVGRSPGGGHGNPLQYSGLENPMDRGGWRSTVHGVAQSWTGLNNNSSCGGPVAAGLREENEYLLIASECQTWG